MKNRRARLLGVLFGVLISASTLFAQNAVSLRGQVVDEQGAVIAGARATLVAADGKKRTAVANANGEFTIPNVLPGSYTLTVEFKGFQSHVDENLQLPTAFPLKISLTVAPLKAETEVNAESSGVSVEPDQNMNAIILDEKMIMDLLPDNEDADVSPRLQVDAVCRNVVTSPFFGQSSQARPARSIEFNFRFSF